MGTHMARWLRGGLGLSLLIVVLAPAAWADQPTVAVVNNPTLGSILVNSSGFTLYHLVPEQNGHVLCTGMCTQLWGPLLLPSGVTAPTAAPGITGTLGVTTRPEGGQQVTYNGWPLYTFARDQKAGDTNGEAFFKVWFVVRAEAVPLAATVAERLNIRITTSRSTTLGVVTARFTYQNRQIQSSCAISRCQMALPYGVTVHLTQKSTNGAISRFVEWRMKVLQSGAKIRTTNAAATSLTMNHSYRVTAVYTAAPAPRCTC